LYIKTITQNSGAFKEKIFIFELSFLNNRGEKMPTFLFMPEVEAVFEELRFGEGVLIEYNSLTHPDLLLYMLIQWAKKREYKVIVDDNLDTFYTFKTTLDLLGLDTRILEDILVVNYSSLTQGAS